MAKDELSADVDPLTIDFCKQEMESVYNSVLDLFQKNKIDPWEGKDLPASKKAEFDTKRITRLVYLLATFEKSRGATNRMIAVLPLIGDVGRV